MKKVASRRFVLGWILAVLIVILILHFPWRLTFSPTDPGEGTVGAGDGRRSVELANSFAPFTITGSATQPISPGSTEPLDLSLTNPNGVPMSVTELSVTVRKVNAPRADAAHPCVVADFIVAQTTGNRLISLGASSTRTLSSLGIPRATWPVIGMLDRSVNQDGCKGASLTLAYTALGTAVPR